MSWEKTTIGKHCTVTSSKRFHLSDRSSSGVPFYCSKEIIQKVNGEEVTESDFIHQEAYENVKKQFGVPGAGDLLITTRGTYGVPYIYKVDDHFYFADGNLTWLKDFRNMLPQYLFYWVRSYEGQKKIDAIAKGTAQKAVPIASIKKLELLLPLVDTQQRIVDILSAYDSLIENNQKQIKLLEEAAQRLYKEWFVDLHFPGYEDVPVVDGVPEGWKKITVGEFIEKEIGGGWGEEEPYQKYTLSAYVIRGTDMYGITHGDFRNIPFRYHAESSIRTRRLQAGDIIFEVSGGSKTEGVARACLISQKLLEQYRTPVICASFCKKIRPKESVSQYLYDAFQFMRKSGITSEYDKRSASSIVNYRWKDFLSQECLLMPTEEVMIKYDEIAGSIFANIQTKSIGIETAKQARDRLLPKLMSGELEV